MFFRVCIEVAYTYQTGWTDFLQILLCEGSGLNLISSVTCHHWITSFNMHSIKIQNIHSSIVFLNVEELERCVMLLVPRTRLTDFYIPSHSDCSLFLVIITSQRMLLCWRCLCKRTRLRSSNNRPTNHQSQSWKTVEVLCLQILTNRSLNINMF